MTLLAMRSTASVSDEATAGAGDEATAGEMLAVTGDSCRGHGGMVLAV